MSKEVAYGALDFRTWCDSKHDAFYSVERGRISPAEALRFAHEVRLRAELMEAVCVARVEELCEQEEVKLEVYRQLLAQARTHLDPAAGLSVLTLQEKKP